MKSLQKEITHGIVASNPLTLVLAEMWPFVQFILNLFFKFSVWVFGALITVTEFIFRPLIRYIESKSPTGIIIYKRCVYGLAIAFVVFLLISAILLYNNLPVMDLGIMATIKNSFGVEDWWVILFIAVGYGVFSFISINEEFGILCFLLTIYSVVSLFDKTLFSYFIFFTTVMAIIGPMYLYSKTHELNFRSKLMEEVSEEITTGKEIRESLKPLDPFLIETHGGKFIIPARNYESAKRICYNRGISFLSVNSADNEDLLKYDIHRF